MAEEKVEVKTEVMPLEEFSAAFAEVVALTEKTDAGTADKKTEVTQEAKAGEGTAAGDKTGNAASGDGAPAKTAEELAAEKAAQEALDKKAADDAQALKDRETLTAAAALVEKDKKAAEVAAANQETAEQKTTREALEASLAPYKPTPDEEAADAEFKRAFPNEYQAMEARLKAMGKEADMKIYKAMQDVLTRTGNAITPLVAQTQAQAQAAHISTIRTAHTDFDSVIPKVAEWIKTQPSLVQSAYQAAYDGGTAQQVIDLVGEYKKSAGITAAAGKTAAELVAEQQKIDEAAALAKKTAAEAASLAPVGTKRPAVIPKGAPDKDDFKGAFAEAQALFG